MPEKKCSICHNLFHLHEHENGLVFDDDIFICQQCTSEKDPKEWSESIMQSPTEGMPIALWLIHEQNKDKPLFSRKK